MNDKQLLPSRFGGQHAVVIGASMAGLLASRVLSDHFEQVTVIERDQLPQPETQGKRPLGLSLLNSYSRRVHELSTSDPQVTLLLYQVLHAIKPPTALFSPPMLAKVLFKRKPRQSDQEEMSASRELSPVSTPAYKENQELRQAVFLVPKKV